MNVVTSSLARDAGPRTQATSISLLLLLWVATLSIFPLYVFPPASVQVSDMLMAVVILLVSLSRGYPLPAGARSVVAAFVLFAWYVVLISIYRTMQTGSTDMMMFAAYYAFNVLRLVTILRLYARYRERFLRMTLYGLLGAALLLLAISVPAPLSLRRAELSFNNPNQLGYFALLGVSIVYVLTSTIKVRWFVQAFGYLSMIWFAALSLSKAAMISMAAIGIVAVFRRNLMILILGLALVSSYASADPNGEFIERLIGRFATLGQSKDDSWQARGYGRFTDYPEYLVLGAGEGDYGRFDKASGRRRPQELHSTMGTLIFAYGIPGSLLFFAGLAAIVRMAGLQMSLLLGPVLFVYGLGHQGLRFGFFWVLLALLFCAGHARRAVASPAEAPTLVPASRGAR